MYIRKFHNHLRYKPRQHNHSVLSLDCEHKAEIEIEILEGNPNCVHCESYLFRSNTSSVSVRETKFHSKQFESAL